MTKDLMIKVCKERTLEHPRGKTHSIVSDIIEEPQLKLMEIKLIPRKLPKKIFDRVIKIENEHNVNTRRIKKKL